MTKRRARKNPILDDLGMGRDSPKQDSPRRSRPHADTLQAISDGDFVPIIGNGFPIDLILDFIVKRYEKTVEQEKAEANGKPGDYAEVNGEPDDYAEALAEFQRTIISTISKIWADYEKGQFVQYPFPDDDQLSKVANFRQIEIAAQFDRYRRKEPGAKRPEFDSAKHAYLWFLKELLLGMARKADQEVVKKANIHLSYDQPPSLSQMIVRLDDSGELTKHFNSLELLASFDTLPLYITTSYYDYMERALYAVGRKPRTFVCFWIDTPKERMKKYLAEDGLKLDAKRPIVYHLFGYEEDPATMVLTEDDYLDVIRYAGGATAGNSPVIPSFIRSRLSSKKLMLLGYRFDDLEFKALFRGLICQQKRTSQQSNLLVHLEPGTSGAKGQAPDSKHVEKARSYLKNYLHPNNFEILWTDPNIYLSELAEAWRKRPQ